MLTPLENRQIRAQVNREVLVEEGSRTWQAQSSDSDSHEVPRQVHFSDKGGRGRSATKSVSTKAHRDKTQPSNPRIEGLSYKRLVKASMVLGQVCEINRHDIGLSLPNNLTGYVPAWSLSTRVRADISASAEDASPRGEPGRGGFPKELVGLRPYFKIGQYLRGSVVSTREHSTTGPHGRKHIELSLLPEDTNAGLSASDLVRGATLQAEVTSIEDHGLAMSLGMSDPNPSAFLPFAELDSSDTASRPQVGAILLCVITDISSGGKVIRLSANPKRMGEPGGSNFLGKVPTIATLLPGTGIEFKVSHVTESALVGGMMDLVSITADVFHSGRTVSAKTVNETYQKGAKVKARIISSPSSSSSGSLLVSILDHVLHLGTPSSQTAGNVAADHHSSMIASVVPEAPVEQVIPGLGLFMNVGEGLPRGFAHVSRLSDKKVDLASSDTRAYKVGSIHKARVLSFNLMDGLFILSLEPSLIEKPFLSIKDIKVGDFVRGTIHRLLLDSSGVCAIAIDVGEKVKGYVQNLHFATAFLKHPELKFKEGKPIQARVLSIEHERRRLQLTLKKLLMDESVKIITSYEAVKVGDQAPATIVSVKEAGAIVHFFGNVRAFLPASQVGEEYTQNPLAQLSAGQVISVTVISVDVTNARMTVSCRGDALSTSERRQALELLQPGMLTRATVSGKTDSSLLLKLEESGVPAELPFSHVAEESSEALEIAKKARIGKSTFQAAILGRDFSGLRVRLTCKPALIQAFQSERVPKLFSEVKAGMEIVGFVKNITSFGIFVEFADGLTGLLPKARLEANCLSLPSFGFSSDQSIPITVLAIDVTQKRFMLTTGALFNPGAPRKGSIGAAAPHDLGSAARGPLHDIALGMLTVARIVSVRRSQINVELAGGVPGRVDVSAAFDSMEDIKDWKHPLSCFKTHQTLSVRVLGVHDSRNHRFLPISHRGHASVFELSARPRDQAGEEPTLLSLDHVKLGDTWPCFINNVEENWIWVNLSPAIRGRINILDASDDAALLEDVPKNFPVGGVLFARVISVDLEQGRLDLSAKSDRPDGALTLEGLSPGSVLPARVTKVSERHVFVQLGNDVSGPVQLTDLNDDFTKANPAVFRKNQVVRVYVTGVDEPRSRIQLSLRPSKVSGSQHIKDPDIVSLDQLQVGGIVRGFIKLCSDSGVFVALGTNVTAFVRISDLSDGFVKDWKSEFKSGQLVEGKVIHLDAATKQVRLSLKKSHVDKDYQPPLMYSDYEKGQTATGKVRKVESFGIFVVLDKSSNVSGLCHRSEVAEDGVNDTKALFKEGDSVKVKILSVDPANRRMTLGLKASYFADEESTDPLGVANGSSDSDEEPVSVNPKLASDSEVLNPPAPADTSNGELKQGSINRLPTVVPGSPEAGDLVMDVGGFEWYPEVSPPVAVLDPERAERSQRKKKTRGPALQIDRTGDLDANGPQSEADYERLLLSQPNSSLLWLGYMALYLDDEDVTMARKIADRAVRTVNHQSVSFKQETLDIWVAYLNLENTYGDGGSLKAVFDRACEYNDAQEMHEHLASILIRSGKATVCLFDSHLRCFNSSAN